MRLELSKDVSADLGGFKKFDGRACKPDFVPNANRNRPAHAAIIPLGHDSHRDSSSLPEGFQLTMACATAKRNAFIFMNACSSSRAGSPLLFGLAPRGVFRAPGVTTGAVGSYPTFSPLPNVASISKTSHRFPCAMPPRFTPPAVYSLWHFP